MFTQNEILSLIDAIDFFNTLFISSNIGSEYLTQSEKLILTNKGINWQELRSDYPDYAFRFGILASALKDKKKIKDMTFDQLRQFIASGKFLPLSTEEQYTLNIVKNQLYKDVVNLRNKMVSDLYQISIDHSQKTRYQKIIKKEAVNAVDNRLSVSQFSSILSEKTQDWNRDFDRIADYIMHASYQSGKANAILVKQPVGAKVWFRVHKGACVHCKRVYILNQKTGEPRVYYLKDVMNNGSNIGIKAKDYHASTLPLHPFCRCDMWEYLDNTKWSNVKQDFILVRNTYGVNRKSKVKITITE